MNFLSAVILVLFYASSASTSELSAEKKTFIDTLNKDRQEVGKRAGEKMNVLTYDPNLEKLIPDTKCEYTTTMFLRSNDIAKQSYDSGRYTVDSVQSLLFFTPTAKTIACSKSYKCSVKLQKGNTDKEELIGKEVVYRGICILKENREIIPFHVQDKLDKAGMTPISKYADILGVPNIDGSLPSQGSAAGTIQSLIIAFFLVFYI
ncbi:unnamed protein product [Caenorhabditis brenneri]